jgi:F-box-like
MLARSSMDILSLADEVTVEIFAFLGAMDTARSAAQVCRHWHRVANHSRALWRCFVCDDFGLTEGVESADWKKVYAYIKVQERAYLLGSGDRFIQSRLVFCDDGSHQPGNKPEHALSRNDDECWCTNAFVDHDVDLVADLTAPHLVMSFTVANGGLRFSAPVKEALAFASLKMPDLEAARAYDGSKGIHLAHEMVAGGDNQRKNNNNNNNNNNCHHHHPLAGFVFPGIPQAFNAICSQPAARPTVARFVHFKLLTSSKCGNRVSNNIDVCNLFTFGMPLPELAAMIHTEERDIPLDPSRYARHHQIREYPWHIHEAFQQQERQLATVAMLVERVRRQRELLAVQDQVAQAFDRMAQAQDRLAQAQDRLAQDHRALEIILEDPPAYGRQVEE